MTTDPNVLRSFLPGQLIDWLAERSSTAHRPLTAEREMVSWFADLSNFSHLTAQITERERAGPELLGELLNEVFGAVIERVLRFGGQVLEFAGDSVLATWPIGELGPGAALAAATQCGLDVVGMEMPSTLTRESLDLRVGIGVGSGVLMELGGLGDQWHFAIGGSPFAQMGRSASLARPGEVILSPEAARVIGDSASGVEDPNGFLRVQKTRTDDAGLTEAIPPLLPEPSAEMLARLSSFLPPALLRRIEARQGDWLAEFRQVTSVFVNLSRLDPSVRSDRETLQDVVMRVQESLARLEGALHRVLQDDKGVILIASFGLPPFAHEDDPSLAVRAAQEIQRVVNDMRLEYGIGVATGRAFCGTYGSPLRREYTTLGQEVNLAARLMQAARYEVLCDEATMRTARRIEFHPLGERPVRGWDRMVPVYRPLWEKTGGSPTPRGPGRLVGRETEENQLLAWLGALVRARSSAVVVVEGEAGIGKSVLASDSIRKAESFEVQVLTGAALGVAQSPYQVWRSVITEVMGLTGIRSLARRQELVREKLAHFPQFSEWEALLNSVLDLQFPETPTTRGMSGSNRRESTVELLVALLSEAAARTPLMIVLDDAQWFDSASWTVTLAAARKVSPLLLLLLTRPMLDRPEQMEDLMQLGTSARLLLQPLSQDDTLALARERLGVQELGSSVATVIVETSEGIPLFVEELALSLRETGAISLADGTAELIRPPEELGVPHSLSSVLLSRIDRLQPELALTLKVASVIGRSFDSAALATVHPAHPGAAELARELERLKELDLIVESSPGSYDFKHALTRDTAYDLLVFDQRRQIHRAVANHLESRPDQPAETLYPFLAYHWDRAEDFSKAQTYFEKTGASALRRGANQEAIAAHSRSLDLVSRHPEEFRGIDQIRQSQWHVEIGQAHEALGNFDEALSEFYRALELVGVHLSTRPMARFGRLITESLTQLTHIILPGAIRTPEDESERTRLAQAARISSLIGEIYYFTGNLAGFPLLNLVAINLGERSGEPLVAGLAYASLGYLVGTLRLRRLADRYFRRARAAEDLETRRHWLDIPFVLDPEEMGPGHLIAAGLAESVLALTFDEWERAREIVTEALERCERLGDKYSAGIALAVRGFVNYSSGEIANALDDYRQLLASARQRSNREHEGWATSFVIPVLLAGDQVESAQAMTVSAMSILNDVDPLTVPIIHATRSQVQLRLQAREEARASAELALEAMGRTPIFIYLAGFAGMLDTLLELWSASAQGSAEQRSLSRLASQALAKMRTFAWVLPFARPKYWLFRGRIEDLKGRPTRAQRHWRRGLSIAQRSRFIWDEGQLHLELARSLPENDPKRAGHVAQARASFETVGSHHDLSRISALEPEHRGPRKTA